MVRGSNSLTASVMVVKFVFCSMQALKCEDLRQPPIFDIMPFFAPCCQ